MLIALVAALREEKNASPRGEMRARRTQRGAREGLLQRENAANTRMKKQHLPMKNPVFPFDAPSFSISIRTASECSVSLAGSINF
jgi:hypothetical protein